MYIKNVPTQRRMNEAFSFELPDDSKQLTEKEYVGLVNRIRGNFLSYVSVLDSTLALIITDYLLRDKADFALWEETVFDERASSFGTKMYWLGKIISNNEAYQGKMGESWSDIAKKLDNVRVIRNEFAHNAVRNKQVEDEDVRDRVIRMYYSEEDERVSKTRKMSEIMEVLNDSSLSDQLNHIKDITQKIRK